MQNLDVKRYPVQYDEVVRQVRTWPAEQRYRLIQDLLRTIHPAADVPSPARDTLSEAWGFLKTEAPPPTDEEVRQWLDEARMEKWG